MNVRIDTKNGFVAFGNLSASLVVIKDLFHLDPPDGPVLRPLLFGERNIILFDSLRAKEPVDFCTDLIKTAALHEPDKRGEELPLVMLTALKLAGAGDNKLTMAETMSAVALKTGWSADTINKAKARDIDALALKIVESNPRNGWNKIIFQSAHKQSVADGVQSLVKSLLQRFDEESVKLFSSQGIGEDNFNTLLGEQQLQGNSRVEEGGYSQVDPDGLYNPKGSEPGENNSTLSQSDNNSEDKVDSSTTVETKGLLRNAVGNSNEKGMISVEDSSISEKKDFSVSKGINSTKVSASDELTGFVNDGDSNGQPMSLPNKDFCPSRRTSNTEILTTTKREEKKSFPTEELNEKRKTKVNLDSITLQTTESKLPRSNNIHIMGENIFDDLTSNSIHSETPVVETGLVSKKKSLFDEQRDQGFVTRKNINRETFKYRNLSQPSNSGLSNRVNNKKPHATAGHESMPFGLEDLSEPIRSTSPSIGSIADQLGRMLNDEADLRGTD